MRLNELSIGKSAEILSVGGEGTLRLRFLDMGLIPGTKITINKAAPLGDPIQLSLRGYTLTLRLTDAEKIVIKEI